MFEDNLKERYGLAIDRIAEIKENSEIEDAGLAAYFTYTAEFLLLVDKWNEKRKAGGYDKLPLEELQHWNTVLYENVSGNIDPEELAMRLNISYSWFRRVFKEYTGYAPAKYFQELKLRKAKQMLVGTSQSVKEISFFLL